MGYPQIELNEKSQEITTITTHKVLYRCKRLVFGISSEPEMHQHVIQLTLTRCEGACIISKWHYHFDNDQEEHDKRLKQLLIDCVREISH